MGDGNRLPGGAVIPAAAPITVGFAGGRAGSAALTWAQRQVWELSRGPRSHTFNLQRLLAVPGGMSPDDAARAVRTLVERYETFRTTIDRDGGREPVQRVHAAGELPVMVYDTAPGGAAALVEVVGVEQGATGFEDDGWPLRVGLVAEAGWARYAVLTASHVAVDRIAMDLACRAFAGALRGRPPALAAHHPLDVAAEEGTGVGQAIAERAIRYWRRTLEKAPAPAVQPPAGPPVWPRSAELTSPAAGMAAAVLAARHRASLGAVLVAALSAVLGVHFAAERLLFQALCANRLNERQRALIGTAVQPGLLVVDLRVPTFDALVPRVWSALLTAYRYARYPYPAVAALPLPDGADVGYLLQQLPSDQPLEGPLPTRRAIERAVHDGTLRSDVAFRGGDERLRFEVSSRPGAGMVLGLTVEARLAAAAAPAVLLRGMETLLVAAVGGELTRADVRALVTFVDPDGRP